MGRDRRDVDLVTRVSARLWRLFHEDDLAEAEPGRLVELDGEESHHALRVLRLRDGDEVAVFDGRGTEWRGTLVVDRGSAAARARLEARVLEPAVEPALELTLVQSVLKPERMDWVVQKATELGVAAICALEGERAETVRPGRLARWRRIAVEACKQSGRRKLPELSVRAGFDRPMLPGRALEAWILDPRASEPIGRPLAAAPHGPLWLASGPEAGFTPGEVAAAREAGWRPVSLGPRVLRADTAGVVAAAIVLHRWGDLGSSD